MIMELRITLEVVTPLFLSGADPNDHAELRPPSVKGALRFWYRALDHNFRGGESAAFGSTENGQSPVILQLEDDVSGLERWNQLDRTTGSLVYERYNVGSGTHIINGIVYLGYSLNMGRNEKRAIAPGRQLHLTATLNPRRGREAERRAWVAAFWCLAYFGGLGTRARRGFGSLRLLELVGWPTETERPPALDIGANPTIASPRVLSPISANDPAAWLTGLQEGLATLQVWYWPRPSPSSHPVLDERARIFLVRDDLREEQRQPGFPTWDGALDAAGRIMQTYRQRRPSTEYAAIKAQLTGGPYLTNAPSRAAFGLPLTFRSSATTNTLQVSPVGADRQPSPLLIRVARIGERFYPLFVLLNTPYLDTRQPVRAGQAGRVHFARPPRDILNDFLDMAVGPLSYPEVNP